MSRILVTGGCGYIGSHTAVDLMESGFETLSVDNYIRSQPSVLACIEQTVGRPLNNYEVDLRQAQALRGVFEKHRDIQAVVHFAALKSVPESVARPLDYYDNNLNALLNVLSLMREYGVRYLIFSSSCSVYGNAEELPVRETTPHGAAQSPYAHTKQIGEHICQAAVKAAAGALQVVSLRYFNPCGAHPGGRLGEIPQEGAYNVVPLMMESYLGLRPPFVVTGTDYPTPDGSCIRDYIHVCDVAHAHTLALQYLLQGRNEQAYEVFNIGLGQGVSVLELVNAFERANNLQLPRQTGARRPGDVAAIYAHAQRSRQVLGWQPRYTIEDMMRTAWDWERYRRNV